MTQRIVSDRQNVLEFLGYKLDDADAWLESLKDNGLDVTGTLVKSEAATFAVPA